LCFAFSPEREDPGRNGWRTEDIPKLVGGIDDASRDRAVDLYRMAFASVVPVDSAEIAEAAKVVENSFRLVNIAFVNELKRCFQPLGIDVWKVIDAAATKPYGYMPFWPGPGVGGHCIPVDPVYLCTMLRDRSDPAVLLETAVRINREEPRRIAQEILRAVGNAGTVLVVGVAYKPGVNDSRETPATEIIETLELAGCRVDYHDPFVPEFMGRSNVPDPWKRRYNAVVIVTDHSGIQWSRIREAGEKVFDTRNVFRGRDDVVRL
jgi:UDP-N-acetyl-D-glucosamine dehydrogenase